MKPIELTEIHKAKLLEMCKALFPEYDAIEIDHIDYPDSVVNLKSFIKPENCICPYNTEYKKGCDGLCNTPSNCIHWFEFCMIDLFNCLLSKNYLNAPAFYTSILAGVHPVELLYEHFEESKA